MLAGKLGQHVGSIATTGVGQTTQLVHVTPLSRQLNELIDSVPAAGLGEPAQLFKVAAFTG